METSKVYIQTDHASRILRCEGGYTTPADLTGWTCIDEGSGDRYNLCQSHYFDGGLYTQDGIPLYRWDGSQVVERTEEEIEADRADIPVPPPTEEEDTAALLVEHEYRLTLLELGITEQGGVNDAV